MVIGGTRRGTPTWDHLCEPVTSHCFSWHIRHRGEPMPKVYAIDGVTPVIDPSAFVHPDAVLIGDVIVGPGCYVAPGASLRGDMGRLVMGRGANLQDNCIVHGFPGTDTVIEEDGHI